MANLEGGHIEPPPHSSYIQKPRTIRVNILFNVQNTFQCLKFFYLMSCWTFTIFPAPIPAEQSDKK